MVGSRSTDEGGERVQSEMSIELRLLAVYVYLLANMRVF